MKCYQGRLAKLWGRELLFLFLALCFLRFLFFSTACRPSTRPCSGPSLGHWLGGCAVLHYSRGLSEKRSQPQTPRPFVAKAASERFRVCGAVSKLHADAGSVVFPVVGCFVDGLASQSQSHMLFCLQSWS